MTPLAARVSPQRRRRPGLRRAVGGAGVRARRRAARARRVHAGPSGPRRSPTEIQRAQAAGDPDTGETYYRHWLAALERLVAEKGVADAATLARYADAWERAADRTPHGTPIELAPADFAA